MIFGVLFDVNSMAAVCSVKQTFAMFYMRKEICHDHLMSQVSLAINNYGPHVTCQPTANAADRVNLLDEQYCLWNVVQTQSSIKNSQTLVN